MSLTLALLLILAAIAALFLVNAGSRGTFSRPGGTRVVEREVVEPRATDERVVERRVVERDIDDPQLP